MSAASWKRFRPLDVGRIAKTLQRHDVKYVVIGGMAAVAHGLPWQTDDIDICPATSADNLRRLAQALTDLDARLRAQGLGPGGMRIKLDERTWKLTPALTFTTAAGPLDVDVRPSGTDGYRDLIRAAETREVEGVTIPVASLEDVARSKEAAGRPKDLERLPELLKAIRRTD
ncbi:MAG: nucleotidyltransferase [Candidatus Dormibacteraeota bacterium]|nr:nucleotidyltransferase [Candidatus Dormibacteraeota bacterium]